MTILHQTEMRDIALALGLKPNRNGYSGACPSCGYPTGFTVTEKNGRALFYCHAGGCRFEEILAALRRRGLWGKPLFRSSFATVANAATAPYLKKIPAIVPATACNSSQSARYALGLWYQSKPAPGTPVETYLHSRGITCPIPASMRFHPSCWHSPTRAFHPAMVAIVTPWQSSPLVAVHRTYLKPDGSAKIDDAQAKMILGPVKGHSVHLNRPEHLLAVTEGIETALSVYQATGIPTWSALSWGGIQNLMLPPLPQASEVIICADNDAPGLKGATMAAQRWTREGRIIKIAKPVHAGTDFNDVLLEMGEPG